VSARRFIYLFFFSRLLFIASCGFLVFAHYGRGELRSYEKSYPPLIEASFKGDLSRVKRLLAEGADPNVRAFDNTVALHFVCRNGSDTHSKAILKLLLEYGARVRLSDNNGYTPLHYVPTIIDLPLRNWFVGELVKNGADVNARTQFIESGTVPGKKNKRTYSVLDMIVDNYDRTGIIDVLQNWGTLFAKDSRSRARTYAYDDGFRDIAREIDRYERGTYKSVDGHGLTPLMMAAIRGSRDEVVKLAKDKRVLNGVSRDDYKQTALHLGIKHHRVPVVKALVKAGARVDAKDWKNNTLLHALAQLGNLNVQKQCVPLFVKKGAKLTAKNKRGDTVLHLAIRMRDEKFIEYLMKKFKDHVGLSLRNKDGQTALSMAKKLKLNDIVRLLR